MKFFLRRVLPVLFLVVVLLANSTAAFALERKDNDSKGQYTVKDPRNYPIIFIPGMAGSKLDIEGGANAWPGSLNLLSDEAFKVLALKSDGKSPLYGTKVIPTDTIKFGLGENPDEAQMVSSTLRSALTAVPLVGPILGFFVDEEDALMFPVYQGFYTYMEEQGYKLNENPETGKVFFDFPYDFRQDNRNWTSLLDKKVNEVRKKTGSDKVILVGHSMGGIQARLYMKDANRAKKVAAVVFMGTPHHGAPMAFYSFTEGYNFDNSKLSDTRMWEIAANWAGGYQLMPDYPFILDGNDPSRRPVGIEAVLKENWISSQEYARYLEAKAAGKDYEFNRGFPNDKFAADSIKFSNELGDSVDKYPGVKYYMIRGTNQKTVQYLVAYYVPVPGLTEDLIRFDKQFYPGDKGDGTVPLEGALVDGLDGVYEVESGHGDIPNNAQAQELLTGIRKQVNNEDYRKELVDKATTMAGVKMASFSKGGFSGKWNIWDILGLTIFSKKDEKKQELKKQIREIAASVLKNCRANVTIKAGPGEAGKDPEEHLYIVVDNFKIADSGTGTVSGANIKVTVDSYKTFENVLKNPDDTYALAEAYKSGAIKVQGGGFTNMLIGKLMEWYRKYM
jgi:uncharacterized alpha/beta hydrolase family protein